MFAENLKQVLESTAMISAVDCSLVWGQSEMQTEC